MTGSPSYGRPKNLPDSQAFVRLTRLIYEGFFALLGGVGAMEPDGMRR